MAQARIGAVGRGLAAVGAAATYGALLLMIVPAIAVSALYAYRPGFSTYTLDATLVIAVTYLGTIFAATILRPAFSNRAMI